MTPVRRCMPAIVLYSARLKWQGETGRLRKSDAGVQIEAGMVARGIAQADIAMVKTYAKDWWS